VTKLELEFRQELAKLMKGAWALTIHVENRLNPGVPDLSYVMNAPGSETGWLELKACNDSKTLGIHVEPSQHRWFETHSAKIPAHLLIAVGDSRYLLRASDHREFLHSVNEEKLSKMAVVSFHREDTCQVLAPALIQATQRGQNAPVLR
jgi:hypothetical protein